MCRHLLQIVDCIFTYLGSLSVKMSRTAEHGKILNHGVLRLTLTSFDVCHSHTVHNFSSMHSTTL
jgi:hypothetical protein